MSSGESVSEGDQAHGKNTSLEYSEPENSLVVLTEECFEAALRQVRPSAMDEVILETPKVSWADVGGQQETKDALTEALIWPSKVICLHLSPIES